MNDDELKRRIYNFLHGKCPDCYETSKDRCRVCAIEELMELVKGHHICDENELINKNFQTLASQNLDFWDKEEDIVGKDVTGKLDFTSVPLIILREVAKVREFGIEKYKGRDNWKLVPIDEFKKAIYRHWIDYLDGKKVDDESGLSPLAHMACNIGFVLEMENTDR